MKKRSAYIPCGAAAWRESITVSFFGQDEVVEITHKATSRQIFVFGALHCAGLLVKLHPGFYTLQQILFERGENE